MTQASLSPDPPSSVGIRPGGGERPGVSSEAGLWLFGLTSLTLVLSSLLLLALLAQDAVADAPLYGFISATAVFIASIGVATLVYVVATAKRAGYIRTALAKSSDSTSEVPDGLRVVPVMPADPASRKRRQRAAEQAARNHQAKAIAAVETKRRTRTATSGRVGAAPVQPRMSMPQRVTKPVPAPVAAPTPQKAPVPIRPKSAAALRPASAVTSRVVVAATPPATTNRPTRAPVVPRMPAPIVRPRTQAVRTQVMAADMRARPMRPTTRPSFARPPATRPPAARPLVAQPVPVRP